jgi:protein SCO1/2
MGRIVPRLLMIFCAAVFAASLAYLLAHSRGRGSTPTGGVIVEGQEAAHSTQPLAPDADVAGLSIPPFTLTKSDGSTITRDALLGHVTIVDFFFTRCIFVCPVLTAQMVEQSKSLRGTGVHLLSISVDPEHETDKSLAAYAIEHIPKDAEPGSWIFGRGDKETIRSIVTDGMKFAVIEDPKRAIPIEGGQTMSNIMHPPWFVLVGPKAEVLGIYRAQDEDEMKALTERARAAAARLSK